ncbi:MAG: DUF4286 family protein [Bacteroidales bacterium]|nr:DUF4286 family protein [Bacteroidales bacterium]
MIIVNITLSFADAIQKSAVEWLKSEYIPLLKKYPFVSDSLLFMVEAQQGADECFALQIHFKSQENFDQYKNRFQQDFETALYAKFTNQFGMFKTVLTSL